MTQLSDFGSTAQPPHIATRVFAWGLQNACSRSQWWCRSSASTARGPSPEAGPPSQGAAGLMFALRWNTLSGSYSALMRASRWYLSSP